MTVPDKWGFQPSLPDATTCHISTALPRESTMQGGSFWWTEGKGRTEAGRALQGGILWSLGGTPSLSLRLSLTLLLS